MPFTKAKFTRIGLIGRLPSSKWNKTYSAYHLEFSTKPLKKHLEDLYLHTNLDLTEKV